MPDQGSPTVFEEMARPPVATTEPWVNRPPVSLFDGEPIGALIRRRRHVLGLSQLQLARLLCEVSGTATINQARISDYEHGRHIPQRWLLPLSAALQAPVEELECAALRAHLLRHQHAIRRAAPIRPITRA